MDLGDAELERRDAADRREVDPPIEVGSAGYDMTERSLLTLSGGSAR